MKTKFLHLGKDHNEWFVETKTNYYPQIGEKVRVRIKEDDINSLMVVSDRILTITDDGLYMKIYLKEK